MRVHNQLIIYIFNGRSALWEIRFCSNKQCENIRIVVLCSVLGQYSGVTRERSKVRPSHHRSEGNVVPHAACTCLGSAGVPVLPPCRRRTGGKVSEGCKGGASVGGWSLEWPESLVSRTGH